MSTAPAASSVVVVAPHPDDEVLGCGGAILTHTASGRSVHVLYLTSGEQGGANDSPAELAGIREDEASAATAVLGVASDRLVFARIPDGGINPGDLGQVGAVVRLLRETRPGLLYVPHPQDGSYDHQAAFSLVWRAMGLAASRSFPAWGTTAHWVATVLGYEVWAPITQPAYFMDITQVLERKLAALACYRSQSPAAKGAGQASHVGPAAAHWSGWRGALTTGGHREAFAVLRLGVEL